MAAQITITGTLNGNVIPTTAVIAANVVSSAVTVTNANTVLGVATLGTNVAVGTGTSIDFTGIATGVKQITIGIREVSFNATSKLVVQIGDAGGIETNAYNYIFYDSAGGGSDSPPQNYWAITPSIAASGLFTGVITLTLVDAAAFTWMIQSIIYNSTTFGVTFSTGYKSTSQELSQLRLTSAAGVNAFDSGSINILTIK